MSKKLKIPLLGLMIWAIAFTSGFFIFVIFGVEVHDTDTLLWISGIKEFFVTAGLALGLFLLYKEKRQDYKKIALKTGVTWYAILLLMDLIVLVWLFGLGIALWYPSILTYSLVMIIPVLVGHLLDKFSNQNNNVVK